MLILDDILASPGKGIFALFREIHDRAREEIEGEGERITRALTALYGQLEAGEITEEEFEARETELLDRLDALWAENQDPQDDDEDAWDGNEDENETEADAGPER
ncbi:gas vesicle protein GvpG [Ectothiorhodospira variabilis]|uniref:gas vesicle protein GvpG n=1 Tax=Ectothiorhodospira variabilis TaxID=505694 RepID=UPI001EFC1801|nr:gas vesicle protein GvpG [Ectothiorhodospira variabilis]MCG5498553.1 gas vesicle protein GvpG [Ectothiorhodospira variabilis]